MPGTSSRISSEVSSEPSAPVALALWLVLATVFAVLAFASPRPERNALYDYGFAASAAVNWVVLVALTFGIAYALNRPVPALGLRRFAFRWVGIAFGVVLASLVVSVILEPFLHGGREQGLEPTRWQPAHVGAFAANAALIVLFGPFAEELFYRGLGVRVLRAFGAVAAIGIPAAAFALAHGVVGAVAPLFVFGAGLAWVRLRADSIWPGYFAHAAYNAIALAITMALL